MTQAQEAIFAFLQTKGVDPHSLSNDSFLLEHIQSVDFMEMIVHLESLKGTPLDLASADIESIMTLGGFVNWVKQENT